MSDSDDQPFQFTGGVDRRGQQRLARLTNLILEDWERPRRTAEQNARKAQDELRTANVLKLAAETCEKDGEKKAQQLEKKLTSAEERAALAEERLSAMEERSTRVEPMLREEMARADAAEIKARDENVRAYTAEAKVKELTEKYDREQMVRWCAENRETDWRKKAEELDQRLSATQTDLQRTTQLLADEREAGKLQYDRTLERAECPAMDERQLSAMSSPTPSEEVIMEHDEGSAYQQQWRVVEPPWGLNILKGLRTRDGSVDSFDITSVEGTAGSGVDESYQDTLMFSDIPHDTHINRQY